jgi:hypothetical protein
MAKSAVVISSGARNLMALKIHEFKDFSLTRRKRLRCTLVEMTKRGVFVQALNINNIF